MEAIPSLFGDEAFSTSRIGASKGCTVYIQIAHHGLQARQQYSTIADLFEH